MDEGAGGAGSWHGPEAAVIHHHDLVQAVPDVLFLGYRPYSLLRGRRLRHVHRRRGVGPAVLAEALMIGQWTVVRLHSRPRPGRRQRRRRHGSSVRREVELGALAPELDRGDVVGARGVLGGVERAEPLAHGAARVADLRRPLAPRPPPHAPVTAHPPPSPSPLAHASSAANAGAARGRGGALCAVAVAARPSDELAAAAVAPVHAAPGARRGSRCRRREQRGGGGGVPGHDGDECAEEE